MTAAAGAEPSRPTGRHWAVLLASAVCEMVWAIALSESNGFREPVPTLVFAVAAVVSLAGLAYGMRGIPIGVAYAVWTGIGAALTVGVAMLLGTEPVTPAKLLFLGGIIACVVGLRFAAAPPIDTRSAAARAEPAPADPAG